MRLCQEGNFPSMLLSNAARELLCAVACPLGAKCWMAIGRMVASADLHHRGETPAFAAVASIRPVPPSPCCTWSGVAVASRRCPCADVVGHAVGLEGVEDALNAFGVMRERFDETACYLRLIGSGRFACLTCEVTELYREFPYCYLVPTEMPDFRAAP